jgi:hypothetical protein
MTEALQLAALQSRGMRPGGQAARRWKQAYELMNDDAHMTLTQITDHRSQITEWPMSYIGWRNKESSHVI